MLDIQSLKKANVQAVREEHRKLQENLRIQEAILGVQPADISEWTFAHVQRRYRQIQAINSCRINPNDDGRQLEPIYPNWL